MFPKQRDESRLLQAMGWEIANVHLGTGDAGRLLADLKKRGKMWLHRDAAKMVAATKADWDAWRKTHNASR
jgi:hypothetical protein